MTYDELVSMVKDYLETDETTFNSNIDQFIKLAEDQINRSVQLPSLRKTATTTVSDGQKYISLPDDFMSIYSLMVENGSENEYLVGKEPNFIKEVYSTSTTEGVPRYFAIFDENDLIIGPTADATYTIEMNYHSKPTSLTAGAGDGTTWLSTYAEHAMLFGTILHGYIFLKGDQDVIAQYKENFERAVADLKIIYEGRNKKDTYRKADGRLET